LISAFERQHGSVSCRQLIGCDLTTEAGQRFFIESNLIERCYQYAADATRLAMTLIAE
jgi:hypothetical protein